MQELERTCDFDISWGKPKQPVNAKANLDIKYLTDRYSRGTAKIKDYCDTHQRYIQVKSLEDCVPDFLEQVQRQGGASLLDGNSVPQTPCLELTLL